MLDSLGPGAVAFQAGMIQCDLPCRHVGLLVVHVIEGRDLKKMDAFGKADPFLELYTQPTDVEKTVRLTCSFSRGGLWGRLSTKVPVTEVSSGVSRFLHHLLVSHATFELLGVAWLCLKGFILHPGAPEEDTESCVEGRQVAAGARAQDAGHARADV